MRILIISRSTLFTQRGGDTVQIEQTAKYLAQAGCKVHIQTTGFCEDFKSFDVLHFFNLNRPADILPYLKEGRPPLVTTAVYINYSSVPAKVQTLKQRALSAVGNHFTQEYIKALARGVNGSDRMPKKAFITKGYKKMVELVLDKSAHLITASNFEFELIQSLFNNTPAQSKIALGAEHFTNTTHVLANKKGVLCVARVEALKNQLTLIKAQKKGRWPLTLVGDVADNQKGYVAKCRKEAGENIRFLPFTKGDALAKLYASAKVHVLPSFYETTGLSTLEALLSGCQVVCGTGGAQAEIFEGIAHFCDVENPDSLNETVQSALLANEQHQDWVKENFSWEKAASKLLKIYQNVQK